MYLYTSHIMAERRCNMKEFIDKLIGRLEEEQKEAQRDASHSFAMGFKSAKLIVNELAEEYKQDKTFQYVLLQTDILKRMGIDVSCKWETATQNAMALEHAYMRGRQDEIDRFAEWQEEHNNGWIPCSERLPKDDSMYLVTVEYSSGKIEVNFGWFDRFGYIWYVGKNGFGTDNVHAWMPLPAPYTEGD